MATTSSSPLVLFIDTDHHTHFSLTIDGDQSIAQLKGRIISDHANCFPEFGEISVTAVKAKRGEFFYHLSDFMILNCFFQDAEGDEPFQVDILPVSSTIKSSEQIKTSSDAPTDERQFENLDRLNCKSVDGTSAEMNEMVQFDTSMKEYRDLWITSGKKKKVLSDGKNPLFYDSLQKIISAPSGNPLKVNSLKVSINDCNNKCSNSYKSETLQLDDSMKDCSDLKHTRKRRKKVSSNKKNLVVNNYSDFEHGREKKMKVSSNEENPLVNNSLQKINDTTSQNQTKMASDAHIEKNLLETNEAVSHNFVHEAPVQLDTNTSTKDHRDLKLKREKKRKVSRNHDLSHNPLVEDSLYKLNRIRADSQTKEVIPTQKKKQRCVGKKILYSRFGSVSNMSNEDELALAIMLNEKKDGIGSNTHCPEKAISASHTKDELNVDLGNTKASSVEHGESFMDKMDDALHKNQTKMDIDARTERKLPETDQDMNCISIHGAPVQLDANTSMKDPSELKRKRKKKKVSRNEELSHYPPVEDSLHKVNDTRADNQPKMSIVKEPISKEKSQPSTIEHAESLLQTTVDDKHNRKERVSEVQPPSKLLKNAATDKVSKHEHVKKRSIENDPIIKIWNDLALKISKEGFTNENIVRSDNNIEEKVPTEKKKQRREAKKIPSSTSGNVLKKSNEDELAPAFMLNEKNDGSGSNRHALEMANSCCRTKANSNVDLDNTRMPPEVILYQKETMDEIKENDNQMNKSGVILKRRIPSARQLKKTLTSSINKKRPKCSFKFLDVVHADEEESRVKSDDVIESNFKRIECFKRDKQSADEFRNMLSCSAAKRASTFSKSPVKSKIKRNKEKKKSVTLKAAEKKLDIYKRLSPDISWVAPPSDYELLQENHCSDPWRVLVICILLNVTQGRQARTILPDFFKLVPNAEAATKVPEEELKELIRPLGLFNKRAALIKEFSAKYLSSDWTHVTSLPGVNKYAADAYAIFCVGRPEDVIPCDHKLVDYWKYLCEMRAEEQAKLN